MTGPAGTGLLLDTDHADLLQRPDAAEHDALVGAVAAARDDGRGVAVSIVSFGEQTKGAVAGINRGDDPVRRYHTLARLQEWYAAQAVLGFDDDAAAAFDRLRPEVPRAVKTMDLRIAAVALANGLTLLTRNVRDFERVPGLIFEDWTRR